MINEQDIPGVNAEFESAYPYKILRWAGQTFGNKLALVTSLQPTGIVTLHMLLQEGIRPDVLTLDTGLLFPETYELMDAVEQFFDIKLIRVQPQLTVSQQAEKYGDALWERQPDACCQMRKVDVLDRALQPYDAWITGIRRDQGPTRANAPVIGWDKRNQKTKLSPLATYTEDMIWTYIRGYELPYNKLHDQGYPSIGCFPCTRAVDANSDDLRDGRWAGRSKTECGIHLPANV